MQSSHNVQHQYWPFKRDGIICRMEFIWFVLFSIKEPGNGHSFELVFRDNNKCSLWNCKPGEFKYKNNSDFERINLKNITIVSLNGVIQTDGVTPPTYIDFEEPFGGDHGRYGFYTFIDNNNDGTYEYVNIESFYDGIVDAAYFDEFTRFKYKGIQLDIIKGYKITLFNLSNSIGDISQQIIEEENQKIKEMTFGNTLAKKFNLEELKQ